MVDFLSGTRTECQACGKDLDFSQARVEDYQRSAGA
jgi:hypothetical protein